MFTRELRIHPLTRAKVPQSFPLVQLAMPQLSLDLWQDYALDHISLGGMRDGGILCAEDERGYILGLLVYRIQHDLSEGNSLLLKRLIAQDQFQSRRRDIALALIRAAEALARQHRCDSLHALVPAAAGDGRDDWLLKLLTDCGHRMEALQLCKPLQEGAGQGAVLELQQS